MTEAPHATEHNKTASAIRERPRVAAPQRSRGRILILVQNLSVPFDRRVWLECQSLVAEGYRVAVVCPKGPGDPAFSRLNGVELFKYGPMLPGGPACPASSNMPTRFFATLALS